MCCLTRSGSLTAEEYALLRRLVLKSARCLDQLYEAIRTDAPLASEQATFYASTPNTARRMFDHVNGCTGYYVAGLGLSATFCRAATRPAAGTPGLEGCRVFSPCRSSRRRTERKGASVTGWGKGPGAFSVFGRVTPRLCSAAPGPSGVWKFLTPFCLPEANQCPFRRRRATCNN